MFPSYRKCKLIDWFLCGVVTSPLNSSTPENEKDSSELLRTPLGKLWFLGNFPQIASGLLSLSQR